MNLIFRQFVFWILVVSALCVLALAVQYHGRLRMAVGEDLVIGLSEATWNECVPGNSKVRGRIDRVRLTDRLDCLVNNASAFEPDSACDFDAASASQQLNVNLMAPLILSKLMAERLVPSQPSEPGCIIHILDQKVFNLNPDYFSYTVSKLALERAVALQARALAPRLRVCGVAPGLMYLSGPQTAENFEKASRTNLMRRAIDPGHVCKTCLFLAGTPAITGVTVTVDNGQHLVPLERDVMFVMDELLKGTI